MDGIGQTWATPENDYFAGERGLHIQGTRDRGHAIDFWQFNPPLHRKEGSLVIRCGICHEDLTGHRHCPHCWGIEEEK